MPWSVLTGLLDSGHVAGWSVAVVLLIVLACLVVRHAERLANAVNQWMLACDRRAARKAALTGKTRHERMHGLAVLDRLLSARPERPAPRQRSRSSRRPAKRLPF